MKALFNLFISQHFTTNYPDFGNRDIKAYSLVLGSNYGEMFQDQQSITI